MSREIALTQGRVAVVDDDDFELLSQWKWCLFGGYAGRYDAGRLVLMHRLINQTPEGLVTDHADGDKLNNRKSNLRSATQLQNMMNRHGKSGGSSRFKGVWLDLNPRNRKNWRAAIRIGGKLKYLGRFWTEDAAAVAYASAAAEHFGEFARATKRNAP